MGTPLFLKRLILLGNLLLLLFVVESTDVNFKVKNPLIANTNGTGNTNEQVTQVKKEEQLEYSNGVVEKDIGKKNSIESLMSKEGQDQEIDDGSRKDELKDKGDESGNNIGGLGEVIDSKNEAKKGGNEESNGSLIGMEKEKSRDDECDPSNMCVDPKKNLTACLRVPGNDSPDLSLLIQNKGSEPVTVTIIAPEYVQLEETKVQLQQKEDIKVKVTVAYEALDSLILLTTEDSRCTLDFRDMIPRDSRVEARHVFRFRYFSNLTRIQCMILFLTLSTFLVFGSAWMCSGMCRKLYQGNGYQTINTELPLSVVSKVVPDADDGWDNSWDNNWEDEEAPKTPALPVTPSLSSRGLASRRLSKEGWKD